MKIGPGHPAPPPPGWQGCRDPVLWAVPVPRTPPDPLAFPEPPPLMNILFFRTVALSAQSGRRRGELDAADRRGARRARPPGDLRLAAPGRPALAAALHGERREVLLCAGPRRSLPGRVRRARLAGRPALARRSTPAAGRGCARRSSAGEGRAGSTCSTASTRWSSSPRRCSPATREAAGMTIVLRMAGLGWHDATPARPGAEPPRRVRADLQRGRCDQLSLGELARPGRGPAAEVGLGFAPARCLRRRHRGQCRQGAAELAGPSAGPGLDIVVATRFAPPQKRQDLLIEAAGAVQRPAAVQGDDDRHRRRPARPTSRGATRWG